MVVLYFLRTPEEEKVERAVFIAVCRNQRGEENVNKKLEEIEKAEKKAEKRKAKHLRELEIKERKLKRAEEKLEKEEERREKVLLRVAKRSIREDSFLKYVLKSIFKIISIFLREAMALEAGGGRPRGRPKKVLSRPAGSSFDP